jgi:hypothetical protein
VVKQQYLKTEYATRNGKVLTQVPSETERLVAPSSTFEQRVLSNQLEKKLRLPFIANQLELGNFRHELEFRNQELIIDCVLESCQFFGVDIPNTYWQAMKLDDAGSWKAAIAKELSNLSQMDVWTSARLSSTIKALDGHWVFAKKTNPDGSPNHLFRAPFVAKGFKQIAGLHFAETFAPTATFVSLQLLLTTAAAYNWPVHSFDFVAAYLNSPIDEEVWVKPPEGFTLPEGHAYPLKKALYGTRQAA